MKLVKVTLKTEEKFDNNKDGEKLRGYLGNYFKDIMAFHNHIDSNSFNYGFSKIQYRIINQKLTIIGIDEGGDMLLENIPKIDRVVLESVYLKNGEKNKIEREVLVTPIVEESEHKVEVTEKEHKYRFETPWLALNETNYKKYRKKKLDLNKTLTANIIEFFKMCKVWADKKITVIGDFQELKVMHKDTQMLGFVGEFFSNADIPSGVSLGKRKSVGYGRITKIL